MLSKVIEGISKRLEIHHIKYTDQGPSYAWRDTNVSSFTIELILSLAK